MPRIWSVAAASVCFLFWLTGAAGQSPSGDIWSEEMLRHEAYSIEPISQSPSPANDPYVCAS
jgi:hypothetical protein